MPEDKNKESQMQTMKKFPIVLVILASLFINILRYYKRGFALLSSLGDIAFTMSLFLILIAVFYEINKHSALIEEKFFVKIKKSWGKIFKRRESHKDEVKEKPQECEKIEESEEKDVNSGHQDDLIEIKKGGFSEPTPAVENHQKRLYAVLYVISFLGIAVWRIMRIFRVLPLSYVARSGYSIVYAVLALVFPCAAVLYLKVRKDDGSCPADKISRDMLMLFSRVSCIYAAVFAAVSVLNINILVILKWTYYAVSVYLVASLAINIVLSIFRNDILIFNYTLFPKFLRIKDKTGASGDSQPVKWNISLKSLYTIRYTFKILPAAALALLFVLFLSTAVFVVQPHQQAAVYRFGKIGRSSIMSEGLHFKFPWPIDKVDIYDVHRAASMQIGYESSGTANFLWTQTHDGGEYMLLLGNGNELVAINIKIIYVISDLYSYIKTCANPELVLTAAAYNALMSRTVDTTLDSFLSVDRNSLSASVLNELSEFCESEALGFSVVQVIIESIHPPVDLADVYQKVVSSSVDKTKMITEAHTYAEAAIIDAQRQSKVAVDSARAMQHNRISDAQKETAVFYAATEAYRISPGSFELTKYLDVYEKIIKGNKVYVFSPGLRNSISKFIIAKVNTVNLSDLNKGDGNE
jgi:regulator of protease activity HflC (stomatin/prohibitin superfamily)